MNYFEHMLPEYYFGSIKIKKSETLQLWIDKGWYQEQLDNGFQFYPGCGRFRSELCTCTKCRNRSRPELQAVINKYNNTSGNNPPGNPILDEEK